MTRQSLGKFLPWSLERNLLEMQHEKSRSACRPLMRVASKDFPKTHENLK